MLIAERQGELVAGELGGDVGDAAAGLAAVVLERGAQGVVPVHLKQFVQALDAVVLGALFGVDDLGDHLLGDRAELEQVLAHAVLVAALAADRPQHGLAVGGQVRGRPAACGRRGCSARLRLATIRTRSANRCSVPGKPHASGGIEYLLVSCRPWRSGRR